MISKIILAAALCGAAGAQPSQPKPARTDPKPTPYAPSPAVSGFFIHDGVHLYYEIYGSGRPLLLIHGNGASIGSFRAQIAYFRKRYRVIAMDSRDQGRSSISQGAITYEKMTGDLAALLDYLHSGPVDVLGWSDGGIEALELGIYYPAKVAKIASMAANLSPDGLAPETLAMIRSTISSMPAATRQTPAGREELRLNQMMLDEPHVPLTALEKIAAPTLILASDHDLIRDDHTLAIYHHIPNGELCIFPNATHMVPYDDPALFNAAVDRFFTQPYRKKDRVQDMLHSFQSMQAGLNRR